MNQIHIKFGNNERLVVLKGVLWGTSQAEINSTDTSGNSFEMHVKILLQIWL